MGSTRGTSSAWRRRKTRPQPLALAINIHRYPVAYIVANANTRPGVRGPAGPDVRDPVVGAAVLRMLR